VFRTMTGGDKKLLIKIANRFNSKRSAVDLMLYSGGRNGSAIACFRNL